MCAQSMNHLPNNRLESNLLKELFYPKTFQYFLYGLQKIAVGVVNEDATGVIISPFLVGNFFPDILYLIAWRYSPSHYFFVSLHRTFGLC